VQNADADDSPGLNTQILSSPYHWTFGAIHIYSNSSTRNKIRSSIPRQPIQLLNQRVASELSSDRLAKLVLVNLSPAQTAPLPPCPRLLLHIPTGRHWRNTSLPLPARLSPRLMQLSNPLQGNARQKYWRSDIQCLQCSRENLIGLERREQE
jgi:hypothetical protein